MSISATVRYFLDELGMPYQLVPHPRTYTSMETAEAAHVPGDKLAKAVLVSSDDGPMIAVVPSTHYVHLPVLRERFGHAFDLASEADARVLFADCELGSVPALGQAYGVRVVVDDAVLEQDEVYFEGGDHEQLVRVSGGEFRKLMMDAERGQFARHVES